MQIIQLKSTAAQEVAAGNTMRAKFSSSRDFRLCFLSNDWNFKQLPVECPLNQLTLGNSPFAVYSFARKAGTPDNPAVEHGVASWIARIQVKGCPLSCSFLALVAEGGSGEFGRFQRVSPGWGIALPYSFLRIGSRGIGVRSRRKVAGHSCTILTRNEVTHEHGPV